MGVVTVPVNVGEAIGDFNARLGIVAKSIPSNWTLHPDVIALCKLPFIPPAFDVYFSFGTKIVAVEPVKKLV